MLLALLVGCRAHLDEPTEWRDLKAYAERAIVEWDVPGVSLAVVDHGRSTARRSVSGRSRPASR